jgi:hypothetical protein
LGIEGYQSIETVQGNLMKQTIALLLSLTFLSTAHATIGAQKTENELEVKYSSSYTLSNVSEKPEILEVAEAVATEIKAAYENESYEIIFSDFEVISLEAALKAVSTKKGEFSALNNADLSKLSDWAQKRNIKEVVAMNLVTDYMSGTGIEINYIFAPADASEKVIVIKALEYVE